MRHSDLADYLDNDPFLESSGPPGEQSPPAQSKALPKPVTPKTPEQPKRSAEIERDKHKSDVLKMVMEVFPGARWTTKEEYRHLAQNRDRKGRKKRG